MDISQIAVGITVAAVGLSILGMLIFGIKSLISGKHEWQKIVTMIVPFAIFGVTFGITGSADEAAMLTLVIMIGLMGLLILFGAVKSTFNF